tara:strand:+ start:7793 stop:8146 length:354 start_codon:yes stop_codon:yes gene_type:complete
VSFINVYQNKKGLWSASLCKRLKEIENIGGAYPNARSAKLDGQSKWGRSLDIKVSYSPMFISDDIKANIIKLISDGIDTSIIADNFGLKVSTIRAIKAHVTMGSYNDFYGGDMVSTG